MVKKLLFFFLVSFLFFNPANAQEQSSAGMKQMQPYVENFTSFSKPNMASDLDAWKKLNNAEDQKHPEFGMLPKDAPCQDCIEIYKKRTRDERYFIDSKDHTKYYKQTALGDLSYEKKGQWLTIEHKLKQKSATVYESGYEHEPAGFEVDQKQGYIKTIKGKVAFNSWTLWSRTAGRQTKLANADWSNYTIGDDGVYIKNVFQGIDAQMIVFRGAIKTNFIMKRNSFGRFDELIFKDSFSGVPGINVSFSDNASLIEGNGEISINATVGELLKMNSAVAYAQGADKDKMIAPSYLLEGQTVGMVIPYKWINENIGNYELIIDPLVSASSTLAQAAITGSAYSSTCISNSCSYNLSVSQPANTTVTDIRWTFNYIAQGSCWLSDGSTVFRMNTCKSPFNDATTYWSCHGGIGTGTCNGNNISIFSDLRSCLPPPSCSIQNLSFQMQLSRCESNSSGCSNSCIGAGSPWTMTIEGRTTEFSNPTNPITLSNTTVCQGGSLTATSSTGIYGRSPYTYSWSFNASGTPVIATGATATINFPAAGNVTLYGFITDSCGNRIAASRAITVMPSASPSVSITATPSGTICTGTSVTFTANHTNGGSLPAFQWRKNGNPVGTNNVSYTDATFSNGDIITVTITSSNTCASPLSATSANYVVQSNPLNAVAQNITVQLDATGNTTVTPTQINNGSSSGCGISAMSISVANFNCSNIGPNTVTLSVTDNAGNTDTATATVIVEDNIAPNAVAQNINVVLDALGNATITAAQINNGSSDNCAIASMTIDKTTFNCSDTGSNTVTLTVTDTSGNTSSATATVIVQNNILPTAVTQNITVQLNASGNASITPAQIDNGSTGNCSLMLSLDITSFNCSNIGANTVTLTVTDTSGNSNSATAIVTVEDNIAPNAIAQNITVQLNALGNATITPAQIDNGSSDNCSLVLSLDNTAFSCANIGANTVVLTATDPSGNTDTATANVTVEDNIAPIAIAQNITVQLDASGNATITPAQIDNGSSDNCAIASMTIDQSAFSCTDTGTHPVVLTVTDTSGNTSSATATVTVQNTATPTAVTQNIYVQLDASGNATIMPSDVDGGSSGNCSLTLALDITSFDCSDIGANTVTLTITDASGNPDTATAIVTVEDNIAPLAIAQNITVQLDASGNATITTAQIDNGSNDNCSVVLSLNNTSFSCGDIGANTVVLTATDPSGNTDTAAATVTIEDNIAPNAIAQNIAVQLDASGNATITPAQIDNGSNDNCAIASMILDVSNFTCADTGANTVTLTVTDTSGNTSSATATVTIEDNIAPNAIAQNITVQLDASGNAMITPTQIDNGSYDNCSIVSMTLDISNFSCADIGANTVILTVTDASGNTDTAIATVTVEDNLIPTAIAQNITVQLDASGNATITTAQIDNGSNDNCAIASMALDVSNFTCADIGTKIVTLNVTDTSGNTDSATAIVTIEDNIAPNAMAQNSIVQLTASGNATITPAQIDNGSSDNCAIASKTIDISNFTCANLGANTVTLTVTDTSGNTSSTTATVIVEDNIAPTAITQNITVPLNASGSAIITPTQINNGSNDNCAIVSMALDISTFSCTDIGTNTVALTVTDASGNNDTATATVTVLDSLPPTIAVNPTTLYLDASGVATLTIAAIDNGTADNCGLRDIQLSKTIFGCADIGNNAVIVTANDIHGNTSTSSVIITIADNLPPTAMAQNIQVSLGTNGTAILTPDMINNNSTDNCGIDSMSLDIVSLNCSNIGLPTVTRTVRDKFGNQDSTTAIVTVLPIPEPVADSPSQTFCFIDSPRVRDIAMASTHIVWYADQTTTNTLSSNAILVTGIYYAATRYGNCYSARIPVSIIVEDPAVATGNTLQYFCLEEIHTIDQLQSDQQTVIWYDISSGGMPLDSSETLESQTYYAAFLENGCESSKRIAVEAVVRNCDVKIYNAVSANGDGRNDFLLIEGVESFPENKLEIFNRWGSPVYEISRYGQPGNLFKGISNTGLASKGTGVLPFGTYFYVFSFTNHDGQRITKNGFIHLNN